VWRKYHYLIFIKKKQSHGSIATTHTSGILEMPLLPNSRRPRHGNITITSGMQEMTLLNSIRQNHSGTTIMYTDAAT